MVTFDQKICRFWIMISLAFFARAYRTKTKLYKMVLKSEAIWWPVRKFPISGTRCLHSKRQGPLWPCVSGTFVGISWTGIGPRFCSQKQILLHAGWVVLPKVFFPLSLSHTPHPFGRMILINDSLENSHKSVGRQTVLQSYCGVRKMEERVAEGFHTMPSVWALTDKTSPVEGCKSQS